MPDEAREVIFPQGIPVTMLDGKQEVTDDIRPVKRSQVQPSGKEVHPTSTKAEGRLASEAGVIKEQARLVQPLNREENLLGVPPGTPPTDDTGRKHGGEGEQSGK